MLLHYPFYNFNTDSVNKTNLVHGKNILMLFMPTITIIITCQKHLFVGVLCTAITDEGS